jgi:hypothetical protein
MFTFFFQGTRKELFSFCGSNIENRNKIVFDINGDEAKFCFRKMENGQYPKGQEIRTRHPNILKSVLTGKSGWGLWRDEWTNGVVEHTFTKEEILQEFIDKKIEIPTPLLKEFDDFLERKKQIRNQQYSEFLGSGGMWK